jgi:hypothetical protein
MRGTARDTRWVTGCSQLAATLPCAHSCPATTS